VNQKYKGKIIAYDSNGNILASNNKDFKVNGNKLPQKVQGVEFNISESNHNQMDTKGSFYKPNGTGYSENLRREKASISSIKENISEPPQNYKFEKAKSPSMMEHHIEFNPGSHPNNVLVPKRGVTLRTGVGAGQKSYSQQIASSRPTNVIAGNTKRMSRAQYAATIAKEGLQFQDRLKKLKSEAKKEDGRFYDISEQTSENISEIPSVKARRSSNAINDSYNQLKGIRRNSGKNIISSHTGQTRIKKQNSGSNFISASNNNQVIVNNKYDVSKLLLADSSIAPTSQPIAQPKKYSYGFGREKISRRIKNGGKVRVLSHKVLY